MTYNDFMTIAETHYTKHCEGRKDAQFECMLAIEEMVADAFPRKAKESESRLLDILCSVDWSETNNNQ